MGARKKWVYEAVHHMERQIDRIRYSIRRAFGKPYFVTIVAYKGYGTRKRLRLQGRVLEDRNITPATADDSVLKNFVNTTKRFLRHEVPHAELVARYQGREHRITCNDEGMFDLWIEPHQALPHYTSWQEVEIELVKPIPDNQELPIKSTGHVLVAPEQVDYVVISDIDDTVIQMKVGHIIQMMREIFLGNAYTRLPFPGAAALYRAFHAGKNGHADNPLLYLSSSPWNLYDLLVDFFQLHHIPDGPVLSLRNYRITNGENLPLSHYHYKTRTIRDMLNAFEGLPVILVGDSGQKDPEIYARILEEYPERVLCIYIRNVTQSPHRSREINKLAEKVIEAGSILVLTDNSEAIAEHAAKQGWIQESRLPDIKHDRQRDQEPADKIDRLLDRGQRTDKTAPQKSVEVDGKRKPKDTQ